MGKRRDKDFYPTPQALTLALVDYFPEIVSHTRVYEPCNGDGQLSKVLRREGVKVETSDIVQQFPQDYYLDATCSWPLGTHLFYNWVVTNPPFNVADKIFTNIRKHHKGGIALLLRLTFLEPTKKREKFLDEDPPNTIIVLPRTSFTGDGKSDSVTCAWMVWHDLSDIAGIKVYTNQQLKELTNKWAVQQVNQQNKPSVTSQVVQIPIPPAVQVQIDKEKALAAARKAAANNPVMQQQAIVAAAEQQFYKAAEAAKQLYNEEETMRHYNQNLVWKAE
jgi:hypothetical protein